MKSEAGITDYFDEDNEQFRCAGVSAIRRVIEPNGLLLPSFSNAPRLIYIVKGMMLALPLLYDIIVVIMMMLLAINNMDT